MLTAAFVLSFLLQAGSEQIAPSAAETTVTQPVLPPAPAVLRLAAGTEVEIELVDKLSSSTSKIYDRFAIRLAAPITDGVNVIPPGATGQGEVIDAARAGLSGKQGKLNISSRYLDLNGRQVRVRGMSLIAAGKSRVDLVTGMYIVPYVGLVAFMVRGGDIELAAGTRATVRLAENVELPINAAIEPTGITQ